MADCNLEPIRFPSCKGRLVEASFSRGAITSDGGAVLLRQADRMLGLTYPPLYVFCGDRLPLSRIPVEEAPGKTPNSMKSITYEFEPSKSGVRVYSWHSV